MEWGDGKKIAGQYGRRTGWNQKWRKPLRESLDLLREELSQVFEREGEKIFQDVWKARDGYIEVILDRSPKKSRASLTIRSRRPR